MPYKIIKKNKKFQTISTDTGKVHGTFSSRKQALGQLRALYVHANPAKELEVITLATPKYEVKKQMMDGKEMHCVMKDGQIVKGSCKDNPEDANKTMQGMMSEMMGKNKMMMENYELAVAMKNPVWLGCAVTNRPHIRLKEHPLSIVEIDGKKFIRVPMMRAGKYRHPQGDLDMTGDVLNQFIENHKKGLADFVTVLDAKHLPDRGALGIFEAAKGGFVQREKAGTPQAADPNGELLVAYAVPTGDDAVEIIEQGKFQHASMEFHPDYKSNVEQTYLSDDMREIDMTIELGGPGSGRKGHGGFKAGFKKAYKAADKPFAAKRKLTKKGLKTFGKAATNPARKVFGGAAKAYGKATKSNFNRFRKMTKLEEAIELNSLIPIYEDLAEYIEQGQDDEYFFFDKDLFDFSEAELPIEEGFYKVDKQTAEEMLNVLDEMAQEDEFAHLFNETLIESEEDNMPEEVQELQAKIARLEAQVEELDSRNLKLEKTSLESQVHALVLELRNLKDNGYSYTADTLNLVQSLMLGEIIGEGDDTIKLEDTENPADIATYYRKGMVRFLKSALVRAKVESTTLGENPTDVKVLEAAGVNGHEKFEAGKKDAPSFWSRIY